MLKLGEYAKRMGISHSWARELFRRGELPHPATRVSERVILVDVPDDFGRSPDPKRVVVYARVSSSNRKDSLEAQKLRILEYCVKEGIKVDEVVTEVASGMNPNRKKLIKVLKDHTVGTIVVEHRDRLTRLNFELIEAALESRGAKILVVDPEEIEEEVADDLQ